MQLAKTPSQSRSPLTMTSPRYPLELGLLGLPSPLCLISLRSVEAPVSCHTKPCCLAYVSARLSTCPPLATLTYSSQSLGALYSMIKDFLSLMFSSLAPPAPPSLGLLTLHSGRTLSLKHLALLTLASCLAMHWLSAALCFFLFALRCGCPSLYETPRTSKLAWTRWWRRPAKKLGVLEWFLASCVYGSPHRKEFKFLGANLSPQRLRRTCSTKQSAIYVKGLADLIALL